MKCELCGENEATVPLKHVVDGEMTDVFVCDACADKQAKETTSPVSLVDFLFGVGMTAVDMPDPDRTCPSCGMQASQLKKKMRLGCPECYHAFRQELMPILADLHEDTSHIGRMPDVQRVASRVNKLQKAMKRAVLGEEFEKAAELRDRINAINEGGSDDGVDSDDRQQELLLG